MSAPALLPPARQRPGTSPAGRQTAYPARWPDPRLCHLVERFGLPPASRAYIEELRWPEGTTCPRCHSHRVGALEARQKHYCRDCRYQFRVTSGTVFHNSHVALPKWLLAIQLMLDARDGFPAYRLWGVLGGSYKTSWFVEHRIRAAIAQAISTDVQARAPLALGPTPAAYRRPSSRHLGAYRSESRWRTVHLDAGERFRATVLALLASEPVSYEGLTATPARLATQAPARRPVA